MSSLQITRNTASIQERPWAIVENSAQLYPSRLFYLPARPYTRTMIFLLCSSPARLLLPHAFF
jgi:hypothetical protein